ncbi:MAG: hypothetical protein ACRDKS_09460 [Actinomycetota bacterium]
MIDIHPVEESLPVEIHQDGRVELVGELTVPQWCTDFRRADEALAEVTQRGLFAVEEHRLFDSLTHYGSVAELREALRESIDRFSRGAESAAEAGPPAEEIVTRADEKMRGAVHGAELVVRERTHISRLRPI